MFPPVSIVWPCSLSVDDYVALGREVEFPRPDCPSCSVPTSRWSGYQRQVREAGQYWRIWVPRVRCGPCKVTHALLPAFVVAGRLDVAETIGAVIDEVVGGDGGVRPPARRRDVPHTTARGWVRRFVARGAEHAISFAALAIHLGAGRWPTRSCAADALTATRSAWRAVSGPPGWLGRGRWRFSLRSRGGRSMATNMAALPDRRQTAFHASVR